MYLLHHQVYDPSDVIWDDTPSHRDGECIVWDAEDWSDMTDEDMKSLGEAIAFSYPSNND